MAASGTWATGTGALALAAATLAGHALRAEAAIEVPSGQEVTFIEMIADAPGPDGLAYRFRFLAPAIAKSGGSIDAETALDDMAALCEGFALARLSNVGPMPSQIIISLSDRMVPFGEPAPDVTQFFEAFRPEGGTCVWEGF